jgi:hypothetical protein
MQSIYRWCFADGDGFDRAHYLTMHNRFNVAYLRQEYLASFDNFYPLWVLDGLFTVFGFERRVFSATFKKVYEGTRQVQAYRLQDLAMGFTQPVEILLKLR